MGPMLVEINEKAILKDNDCVYLSFSKSRATEFKQYLKPVGFGPSVKMCPK